MTRMMDDIHTVDVIYLDFDKALLLAKMKTFGLGEVVVRWIEADRSGRVSRGLSDRPTLVPLFS